MNATETKMKELKLGQVWRQYSDKDYGHIIRWEVISVHNRFAMVQNMATLKQVVCDVASESSFTFSNELMQNEKGWNP